MGRGEWVGRALPLLAGLTAIAALVLAGVPPLGAGWTKEAVIAAAGHAGPVLALAVIVAGGLSAAYAARFYLLVFGRADGTSAATAYWEVGAIALLVAATASLALLWLPGAERWLNAIFNLSPPAAASWEGIASLLAVAIGLYAGGWLARRYASLADQPMAVAVGHWLGLPRLIQIAVVAPTEAVAQWAARTDETVVDALPRGVATFSLALARLGGRAGEWLADGLAEGSARLIGFGGADTRRLQTGLSHHYYALIAVGFALLLGLALFWN